MLTKKQQTLLLEINKGDYILKVYKKTNYSTSFAYTHIKYLKEIGLVEITKKGRKDILNLTNEGKEVKEYLYKIKGLIGE